MKFVFLTSALKNYYYYYIIIVIINICVRVSMCVCWKELPFNLGIPIFFKIWDEFCFLINLAEARKILLNKNYKRLQLTECKELQTFQQKVQKIKINKRSICGGRKSSGNSLHGRWKHRAALGKVVSSHRRDSATLSLIPMIVPFNDVGFQ